MNLLDNERHVRSVVFRAFDCPSLVAVYSTRRAIMVKTDFLLVYQTKILFGMPTIC